MQAVDDLLKARGDLHLVVLAEGLDQAELGGDLGSDQIAGDESDVVKGGQIGGIGHGQTEPLLVEAQGDGLVFEGQLPRQQGDDLGGNGEELVRGDVGDTELAAEKAGEIVFVEEAEFDQVGADLAAVKNAVLQGVVHLPGGEHAGLHEHVEEGNSHHISPWPLRMQQRGGQREESGQERGQGGGLKTTLPS